MLNHKERIVEDKKAELKVLVYLFVSPNHDKAEKRQPRWPRLRQNWGSNHSYTLTHLHACLAAQPAGNQSSWW